MFSLKSIIILLVFILTVHAIAILNHWYWTYSWIDMPMHFLGGILAAMLFFWVNLKFDYLTKLPNYLITVILSLSFVALIGVLWEFSEFFYDIFISSRGYSDFLKLGAADTLGDLFFDLLGGLAASIIYLITARYSILKK